MSIRIGTAGWSFPRDLDFPVEGTGLERLRGAVRALPG
jgi:hypothetical protein